MNIDNNTICGKCSNCGNCCGDILPLNDEDIKKIDDYLKTHKLTQQNVGKDNWSCPFRNETFKRCDIYEVRPEICRVYKCDISPLEALRKKTEINMNKKNRSMSELFFKDTSKIKLAEEIGIKIYKRRDK